MEAAWGELKVVGAGRVQNENAQLHHHPRANQDEFCQQYRRATIQWCWLGTTSHRVAPPLAFIPVTV